MQTQRTGRGYIRWIFAVIIAVLVTLVIVDEIYVEYERDGCERRQPIFEQFATFIETAEQARRADGDIDVANEYARQAKIIRDNIVDDCAEAYPHILPFTE